MSKVSLKYYILSHLNLITIFNLVFESRISDAIGQYWVLVAAGLREQEALIYGLRVGQFFFGGLKYCLVDLLVVPVKPETTPLM